MPRPSQEPPPWSVIRIVWFAMVASTFIYLAVLFFAVQIPDQPPDRSMGLALAVASLAMVALSLVVPRVMFQKSLATLELPTREVVDPDASLVLRNEAPTVRVYEDPSAARRAVTVRFFTPFILGMALSEAVVIHGLVLGILGFPPTVFAPFFVIGCALMLPRFPREDAVMRQAEEATGVRLSDPSGPRSGST
ncbi:MAG: hypothetical protein GXP55_08915 [Deltaproteobacteria bacterium]|nr:hypothetical protein [Deltaproteobacteria bacterium]